MRIPLSVAVAVGVAVAFYGVMIWAAQIAWTQHADPMGALAIASFVAAAVASIAAIALAETYRGNY